MFGLPPKPQINWDASYFYQKVHHLFDHGADWMVSKLNWWIPSVMCGMAVSLFVLGGPSAFEETAAIVLPTLSPVLRTPNFGLRVPEREKGVSDEDEDDDDDEVF